jgi:hypothetical protein
MKVHSFIPLTHPSRTSQEGKQIIVAPFYELELAASLQLQMLAQTSVREHWFGEEECGACC